MSLRSWGEKLGSALSGIALSLALSGCDKSPATEVPAATGASSGAEPADEKNVEPETATESLEEDLPETAQEELPAPEFSEAASQEFKDAFLGLNKWARKEGGVVHAALVDLETDKWLLKSSASEPVNVASNAKLVTAAAALELLGPAHQFRTQLYGEIAPDGRCKRLVLVGGGAPDLTTADLWRLIGVARGRGLAEVAEIAVDQSLFDDNFVPPAFEQQPKEWAPFRAPVSALALDKNAVTLNVASAQEGEPARVWYYPPGVVDSVGRIETGKKGSGDRVTWNLDPKKNAQQPASKVGGRLAEGLGRRTYSRRLVDPRLAGGLALKSLLEDAGVKVTGEVQLGERKKEPKIALWTSDPVAELVRDMGKDSDNFVAEMMLIALSHADAEEAAKDTPWSSARGAKVLTKWLNDHQAPMDGIQIKNGSGLFDANRYSAELLVTVLAQMEDNPRVYQDFVSHLAMGATDGTMKKRMRGKELGPRIRAKTGTLRNVIALSGYIQRTKGRSPAAFSITVFGVPGQYGAVRSKVDATVLKWAELLESEN